MLFVDANKSAPEHDKNVAFPKDGQQVRPGMSCGGCSVKSGGNFGGSTASVVSRAVSWQAHVSRHFHLSAGPHIGIWSKSANQLQDNRVYKSDHCSERSLCK